MIPSLKELQSLVDQLDFALQPIVYIQNGISYGYELLLRGTDKLNYTSIHDFFDSAYRDGSLVLLDHLLREKAVKKFLTIENNFLKRMFYNLDNRIFTMPNYKSGKTDEILEKHGLDKSRFTFEISERHELSSNFNIESLAKYYKYRNYKIAIDDFGTGFSGLQLLYHTNADIIKLDRFFIADIERKPKKRIFVSNIIKLAHILGIKVIAEGIETKAEYYTCLNIGCDMAQGYYIQKPQQDVGELCHQYMHIQELTGQNRRSISPDSTILRQHITEISPIPIKNCNIHKIFESFKFNKSLKLIPLINELEEPIGVLREEDIRDYVYSIYGREVLSNQMRTETVESLNYKIAMTDVNTDVESLLDLYSLEEDPGSIIITENNKYIGILTAESMIKILHQKSIINAEDRNPLTKLPGNRAINEQLNYITQDQIRKTAIIYFDFDNFKPFNDTFGFRTGDRALILFSDLLKRELQKDVYFIGHIGGDDFMAMTIDSIPDDELENKIVSIIKNFSLEASMFYNETHRKNGYVVGMDRDGNSRKFPFLTVSASIVIVTQGPIEMELFSKMSAIGKKTAKQSEKKYHIQRI